MLPLPLALFNILNMEIHTLYMIIMFMFHLDRYVIDNGNVNEIHEKVKMANSPVIGILLLSSQDWLWLVTNSYYFSYWTIFIKSQLPPECDCKG